MRDPWLVQDMALQRNAPSIHGCGTANETTINTHHIYTTTAPEPLVEAVLPCEEEACSWWQPLKLTNRRPYQLMKVVVLRGTRLVLTYPSFSTSHGRPIMLANHNPYGAITTHQIYMTHIKAMSCHAMPFHALPCPFSHGINSSSHVTQAIIMWEVT